MIRLSVTSNIDLVHGKRKTSEQWEFTKKAKTGADHHDEAEGVLRNDWISRISDSLSQIDFLAFSDFTDVGVAVYT